MGSKQTLLHTIKVNRQMRKFEQLMKEKEELKLKTWKMQNNKR